MMTDLDFGKGRSVLPIGLHRRAEASSKGFYLRDKFFEHDQGVFDFAAAGTINRQLGAVVEQVHPDLYLAVGVVLRKLDDSDLVISDSDDRDHSWFGIPLTSRQQFDVSSRDAQFAKLFVECLTHDYILDAVETDAGLRRRT